MGKKIIPIPVSAMPWMCCTVFLVLSKQWAFFAPCLAGSNTEYRQDSACTGKSQLPLASMPGIWLGIGWRTGKELAEAGSNTANKCLKDEKNVGKKTDVTEKGNSIDFFKKLFQWIRFISSIPLKDWLQISVFLVFTHIRISYALCSYNSSNWDRVFSWLL